MKFVGSFTAKMATNPDRNIIGPEKYCKKCNGYMYVIIDELHEYRADVCKDCKLIVLSDIFKPEWTVIDERAKK